MDIHMSNIGFGTSVHKLKSELANILHTSTFSPPDGRPFNFEVSFIQQRRNAVWKSGWLTLPTVEIAQHFLSFFGTPSPKRFLTLGTSRVKFEAGRKEPRRDTLERIRRMPYEDPQEADAREQDAQESQEFLVRLTGVQFGWECRDQVFSVEYEKRSPALLLFDGDRREFRVKVPDLDVAECRIVAIRVSQIAWVSTDEHQPSIFFSLSYPPSFETEPILASIPSPGASSPLRQRWPYFDKAHEPVAPFTSLAIRLECSCLSDVNVFRKFSRNVHLDVASLVYPVERRDLFSPSLREEYDLWMSGLPWIIAFHVEALLRAWLVDFSEVLALRKPIERVLRSNKGDYTAALLRDFATHAKTVFWYGEGHSHSSDPAVSRDQPSSTNTDIVELFSQVASNFVYKPLDTTFATGDPTAPFNCYHLVVTPSTTRLEGPFPERSNRVMRTYCQNQDSFLRVSFQDEDRVQFRFDRDIDKRSFIDRRVLRILLEGIPIAGARFEFLAYSQSALKEHAVWFVKRFRHTDINGYRHIVDASTILQSLGNFRDLPFDQTLIYCPARYAARISQAFTATDASVSAAVGQIMEAPDIKDSTGNYCFTDGAGTMSPQLAKQIWRALRADGRRVRKDGTYPRAYHIRFQGSKGVLSVDYALSGSAIVLRPSMIKFEAPASMNIEIARSFDKPGAYYLNRPLIMLLEGLGVEYDVFKKLQDEAVQEAKQAVESLEQSAGLLESHGLGVSFRLASTMRGLHKLGLDSPRDDIFWRQIMDFAINHVLRELKHRARIPVRGKDSWTLVGVADVHEYLQEDEVFVCVDSPDSGIIYLEGPVLVSRSPTIHPGDVQVVHAIGRPPVGSPFARESLRNTIVFSVLGERPLPSCLGGGDLDGDEYNVTTRPELLPKRRYHPASYQPAPRKLVDHESTIEDVAEFVAEYIISDTLGLIATNWLIIADQSELGILDVACIKCAELHSKAVDYPKTGQPVPLDQIPKLPFKIRPDWNAPETISKDSIRYYPSQRAIGKLFRAITLPAVQKVERAVRFQRRHMRDGEQDELVADILEHFYAEPSYETGGFPAVEDRVAALIDVDDADDDTIVELWELYSSYVSQLRAICADHALSPSRSAMLTEEEAVVGTIVAKSSQPRRRKDLISRLREQTGTLVSSVRDQIAGDENVPSQESLRRAWIAYRLAISDGDIFGARSFGWLVLGNIFDAIKEVEEDDRSQSRR